MQKKVSNYALKRRQGLVPVRYNKDSATFAEGAFKNWRGIRPVNRPAQALKDMPFVQSRSHRFTEPYYGIRRPKLERVA